MERRSSVPRFGSSSNHSLEPGWIVSPLRPPAESSDSSRGLNDPPSSPGRRQSAEAKVHVPRAAQQTGAPLPNLPGLCPCRSSSRRRRPAVLTPASALPAPSLAQLFHSSEFEYPPVPSVRPDRPRSTSLLLEKSPSAVGVRHQRAIRAPRLSSESDRP